MKAAPPRLVPSASSGRGLRDAFPLLAASLFFTLAHASGQDLPAPANVTPPTSPTPGEVKSDPLSLEGEFPCRGRNPDGTLYRGTVQIHVKDGLFLMQWNVNEKKSYGAGLLQGNALGVALDDGVAIYQIVPQAQGASLIGLWATEDAKAACEEVIFIGKADATDGKFPVPAINGSYQAITVNPDGSRDESPFAISGDDILKKVQIKDGAEAKGLLLGDGLAVITPTGLAVLQIAQPSAGQFSFAGRSLNQTTVSQITLTPTGPTPAPASP